MFSQTTYVVYYTTNVNSPEIPILFEYEIEMRIWGKQGPYIHLYVLEEFHDGKSLNVQYEVACCKL